MFIFDFAGGLLFWAFYIACGLIFCVVFMRAIAPKIFKVVIGRAKKHDIYDWKVDGTGIDNFEVFAVVFVSLFVWPATIACTLAWFGLKISGKILLFIISRAIRYVAKTIPEIKIEHK